VIQINLERESNKHFKKFFPDKTEKGFFIDNYNALKPEHLKQIERN